jgi:hypothetical protein
MFFFVDTFDKLQTVEVFPTLDKLARHVLAKLGISIELGKDPIQLAKQNLGNRGKVLTLAAAFKLIAGTQDGAAQELAAQFHAALERYKR